MDPDRAMKALAAPTRRLLFELICEHPRSVADLAAVVPVSRPAVSQHLGVLVEADLARVTAVGTRHLYSASPEAASELRAWIDEMWSTAFGSFGEFVTKESTEERMRMDTPVKIDPVAKTLELVVTPAEAFDLFVNKMSEWWPMNTHSVSTDQADQIQIDCQIGGQIQEVTRDGVEYTWGVITAYDEGARIQFTWHPGTPEDSATRVDIRFDPIDTGTQVTLLHTGWEARGDDARAVRDNYESGWDQVLAPFTAMATE